MISETNDYNPTNQQMEETQRHRQEGNHVLEAKCAVETARGTGTHGSERETARWSAPAPLWHSTAPGWHTALECLTLVARGREL